MRINFSDAGTWIAEQRTARANATLGAILENNTATLPAAELCEVDDQYLRRLAMLWRVQALRGNPEAHKIARVFEVEEFRRLQLGSIRVQPFLPIPVPQAWWKFW